MAKIDLDVSIKDGDKVVYHWSFEGPAFMQSLRHAMIVMTREERVHTTRRALNQFDADGPPLMCIAETLRLIQKEAY